MTFSGLSLFQSVLYNAASYDALLLRNESDGKIGATRNIKLEVIQWSKIHENQAVTYSEQLLLPFKEGLITWTDNSRRSSQKKYKQSPKNYIDLCASLFFQVIYQVTKTSV